MSYTVNLLMKYKWERSWKTIAYWKHAASLSHTKIIYPLPEISEHVVQNFLGKKRRKVNIKLEKNPKNDQMHKQIYTTPLL